MSNNLQNDFVIENLKNEIAQELSIELSGDTSSRLNGKVGGEMTRRLIQIAEEMLMNQNRQ